MSAIPFGLRRALGAFRDRLERRFGSRFRELRLFGSFARGEADEDSDIDVLVLVDGLTDEEMGIVAEEAVPLLRSGFPIAPLPMATEHLVRLRRSGRALAHDLDEEGISL